MSAKGWSPHSEMRQEGFNEGSIGAGVETGGMNEEEGRTVATKAMKRYLTTPRRCQHLRFWHVVASRTICSHEGTLEQMCQFRFPQTSRTDVPLEGVQVTQMGALSLFYDPGRFRGWALQRGWSKTNQKFSICGTTTKREPISDGEDQRSHVSA